MAYRVAVKISITKENTIINTEETTFDKLSFEKMTKAAAEYYKLTTKIKKAIK